LRDEAFSFYYPENLAALEAEGAAFDAAIPLEVFKTLPGTLDFEGRTIEASGLLAL